MTVLPQIIEMRDSMARDIVGQEKILECLLIGMLSNGNLLVDGLPGLAKTRAIKSLSNHIEGTFARIQFTPDITGADIIGRQVYYKAENAGEGEESGVYKFNKGPIFNNVVLADEVNRAPARSQNAILEAMEERQVTSMGTTYKVPDLFMVMATMNPAGQEGTFPMPEAQMDRFLMHVTVTYANEEAEANIIRLVRKEQSQKQRGVSDAKKNERPKTSQETIFAARGEIDLITVPEYVEKYMVDLIYATRYPQRYTYELKSFIKVGVSPRGSLALDRCCRTHAWLRGRDSVDISDVQAMIKSCFRHRIIRGERALEHKITPDDCVDEVLELVKEPAAVV